MPSVNKRILLPGERIRVLVVDDSVVIRRLVTHALEEDSEIAVVGTAANGKIALQRIPQYNPDVLALDIEMPEMDGLETLRHLRRNYPQVRVIMFSTLTERGAAITLEALTLGASDYVTKVSNEGSLDRPWNVCEKILSRRLNSSSFCRDESAPRRGLNRRRFKWRRRSGAASHTRRVRDCGPKS